MIGVACEFHDGPMLTGHALIAMVMNMRPSDVRAVDAVQAGMHMRELKPLSGWFICARSMHRP